MIKSHFDPQDKKLVEFTGMMRAINHRLADLLHGAQQSRLATEADIVTYKKTRKRTEDAVADQAKSGDSSSARAVEGPTSSTSFGKIAGFPALPICRDDASVDKGAEALKLRLSPVDTITPTAASGLLPAGITFVAMRTIFPPTPLLRNFCPTEEMNFDTTTSIQTYATYNTFWQRRVIEKKSK